MKKQILMVLSAVLFSLPLVAQTSTDWQKVLAEWRAKRALSLQSPDGWFSVVGLEWLEEGKDLSFGAAPDNAIHLEGEAGAHLGLLRLEHGSVRLSAPAGGFPSTFTVNGEAAKAQVLAVDHTEEPAVLQSGTFTMFLIKRGDRVALRIKNSQAKARLEFAGLHWYEPDSRYVVRARWIPYKEAKVEQVPTVLGTTVPMKVPGAAEFHIEGKIFRLEPVLEEENAKSLFFILRDSTSTKTTYGAGRFLYTPLPDHGLAHEGEIEVDLNRLINPPCAYTAFATCPLPPKQNRLTFDLPVGEQRYHD